MEFPTCTARPAGKGSREALQGRRWGPVRGLWPGTGTAGVKITAVWHLHSTRTSAGLPESYPVPDPRLGSTATEADGS